MKQFKTYINEWKMSKSNMKLPEFIYDHEVDDRSKLSIFNSRWEHVNDFSNDKVYIDGELVSLKKGLTEKEYYPKGPHKVIIIGLEKITTCDYMFSWTDIKTCPVFDTSHIRNMKYMFSNSGLETIVKLNVKNVKYMDSMFYSCEQLVNVPLFDIGEGVNMPNMFDNCKALSEESKNVWSKYFEFK